MKRSEKIYFYLYVSDHICIYIQHYSNYIHFYFSVQRRGKNFEKNLVSGEEFVPEKIVFCFNNIKINLTENNR